MPERTPGMDHPHYAWSPLPTRPALRWPTGAPVALAVVLLVEHVTYPHPPGTRPVLLGGTGGSSRPSPNVQFYAHREYGHRIGVFRLLDVLDRLGVPPTVAIDAMSAERYPEIVDAARGQRGEFVAHGICVNRIVSSAMSAYEEHAYLVDSRERVRAATGAEPRGWFGPEQSESERTPELVDAVGFDYLCDWPNDEQPYLSSTPRRLVSVPTSHLLDDAVAVATRGAPSDHYRKLVTAAFATLAADGRTSGRSQVLVLRPWLSGQPFLVGAVEEALKAVLQSGHTWLATTGEIATEFRRAAGS
jgi:allantoinase